MDIKNNFDNQETVSEKIRETYFTIGSHPDKRFEHLAKFAAQLLNVPVAVIAFVYDGKIYFKSCYGISGITEISSLSCLWPIQISKEEFFIIENMRKSTTAEFNPLLNDPFGLNFYAAAPLNTKEGYNVGFIAIFDKETIQINAIQKNFLVTLADLIMDYIDFDILKETDNKEQKTELHKIVHDLRNPLTIISLQAELMKLEENISPEWEEMCDRVKDAGKKMDSVIAKLLKAIENA